MNTHKLLILLLSSLLFKSVFGGNTINQVQNKSNYYFVENKGQYVDDNIKASIDLKSAKIFFYKDHIDFNILSTNNLKTNVEETPEISTFQNTLNILNSNRNTKIEFKEETETKYNYYYTHCPQGILGVKEYQKIKYSEVYEGIDLVFEIKDGSLKYSFIVKPYADISKIEMLWKDAENLTVSNNSYEIAFKDYKIIEKNLFCYYEDNNEEIKSNFLTNGEMPSIKFNLENYNKSKTIVIDPQIEWSTYYGGSLDEIIRGISVDTFNNVYFGGHSGSTSGISTQGAYQANNAGNWDGIISKFSPSGKRLWATYIGGAATEEGRGLAYDGGSNVYFTAYSGSFGLGNGNNIHQNNSGGGDDIILCKVDTSGILRWLTYFGGTGTDQPRDLLVDEKGDIVVTGRTSSSSNIATSGVFQSTKSTNFDAFVSKFNSNGGLVWATYFGGNSDDEGTALEYDYRNNIVVTGLTQSTVNIATTGAFQTSKSTGEDALIFKISEDGKRRIWASYYGGNGGERTLGMVANTNRNQFFITGRTTSTNLIKTSNKFTKSSYGGGSFDGFIFKVDTSGALVNDTYFGSSGDDQTFNIEVDQFDNLYIAGLSNSTTGISTNSAIQKNNGGNYDGVILIQSADFETLYCTYFGKSGEDQFFNSTVNKFGTYYASGHTRSSGIATTGAHQTSFGGGSDRDGLLIKFDNIFCIASLPKPSISNKACKNSTFTYSYSSVDKDNKYKWSVSGGTIVGANNKDTVVILWGNVSSGNLKFNVENSKGCKDSSTFSISLENYSTPSINNRDNVCIGDTTKFKVFNDITMFYFPSVINGTIEKNEVVGNTREITVRWNSVGASQFKLKTTSFSRLCSDSIIKNVNVFDLPKINKIFNSVSICEGDSVLIGIQNNVDYEYEWTTKNGNFFKTTSELFVRPNSRETYYVKAISKLGKCETIDSITVNVNKKPNLPSLSDKSICNGESINIGYTNSIGFDFTWSASDPSFSSNIANPNVNPSATTTFYVKVTDLITSCKNYDTLTVVVNQYPNQKAGEDQKICLGEIATIGTTDNDTSFIFSWISEPSGFSSNNSIETVSPTTNTDYVLSIINKKSGCTSVDTVRVSVTQNNDGFGYTVNKNEVEFIVKNPINNSKYTWYLGNGDSIVSTNESLKYTYIKNGNYTVKLKTIIEECEFEFEESFSIISNSLYNNTHNSEKVFGIYPNPLAYNQPLTIKSKNPSNNLINLEIFDMVGNSVFQTSFQEQPQFILNLDNNLKTGLYIISINKENEVYYYKLIIE